MNTAKTFDTAGVAISSLCVIHCLLTPLLGLLLPIISSISEAEWIHKSLVIIAIPLFINLILRSGKPYIFIPAICGIALLLAGAFLESMHDFETIVTIIGAFLLGAAHLLSLRLKRHL